MGSTDMFGVVEFIEKKKKNQYIIVLAFAQKHEVRAVSHDQL